MLILFSYHQKSIVLLMAGMFLEAGLMLKWSIHVDLLMSVEPEHSEKSTKDQRRKSDWQVITCSCDVVDMW